ncbi:glycosyltransferase [Streptomyces sp. NPDC047971]|uniref:glycosyltransferase n=1 Tax=Streptomyces sp. NPDC047971 TaxID=3154499 RepID=UPI0033CE32C4
MNGTGTGRRGAGAGRRFLIAIGVDRYRSSRLPDLPEAGRDADRMAELFAEFGYERVLMDLGASPQADDLRSAVLRWIRESRLGPDDVLVVYYAGYGSVDGQRLRLFGSDSEAGVPYTSVAAHDLVGMLADSNAGGALALLDVCGTGHRDQADVRASVPDGVERPNGTSLHLVAHIRRFGDGDSSSLADAWEDVLTGPSPGPRQRFLALADVMEDIRRHFWNREAGRGPSYYGFSQGETETFFPNPRYVPDPPRGSLDPMGVARLRHEHRDHFDARSRGVAHGAEPGDFFVGRTSALARLADWVRSPDGAARPIAVTGDPGSGKTALLGRFLALTDPDSPARLNTAPQTLPPPGLTVIPLTGRVVKGLHSLAADLATALGLPVDTPPRRVRAALGARTDPVVVVLDGLDEIAPSAYDRELVDFVRALGRTPAVRLLVGARRSHLGSLGEDFEVLDLDAPEFRDEDAVRQVAQRLLTHAPGDSPAARTEVDADDLARRAGHSFLMVHLAARALTAESDPPRYEDLPSLFRSLLRGIGIGEARAARVLCPLAHAYGAGLPDHLWAPLVEELTGDPCTLDDLRRFREQAGGLVVDRTRRDGTTVHRLFHLELAEYLRTPGDVREQQRSMARGLVRRVPLKESGERDWDAADPYILEHLATHAAAGRILGEMLRDGAYASHAEPESLLRALRDSEMIGSTGSSPGTGPAPDGADTRPGTVPGPAAVEVTDTERAAARVLSARPCVLVVATEWSSGSGGLSTFNRHLCVALAAAGAQVFCVVLEADSSEVTDAKEKGVTLLTHAGAPGAPDYGRLTRRPALPEGTEPDLVIGHARITGPAAAHLTEDYFPRARRLHFVHMAPDEIEWHKLGDSGGRARQAEERTEIERELGATAHRVVAVGPALTRRFTNELWGSGALEPLRLDPGFDAATFTGAAGPEGPVDTSARRMPPPDGLHKVLFVGRTEDVRLKGVDLAARACGLVHELRARTAGEQIELFVRGAPPELADEQQRLIQTWSGNPGLSVVVRPYSADPRKLESDILRAGLVVMPSRSEGFGLVGQEAILRGVPVLVSDRSGLAQLLREHLGADADHLIVPVTGDFDADAEEWAARIEKCLAGREEAFERMHVVRGRLAAGVTWSAAARLVLGALPPRPGRAPEALGVDRPG